MIDKVGGQLYPNQIAWQGFKIEESQQQTQALGKAATYNPSMWGNTKLLADYEQLGGHTSQEDWNKFGGFEALTEDAFSTLQKEGYRVDNKSYTEIAALSETLKEYEVTEQILEDEKEHQEKTEEDKVAKEKHVKLKEYTDGMYTYTISSSNMVTVEGLYKNSFNVTKPNMQTINRTPQEIENLLERNEIPVTKENTATAEHLLELDMDLSKENVVKHQNITDYINRLEVEDLQTTEGQEQVVMVGNKLNYSKEDIGKIKEVLGQVDESTLEGMLEKGEPITIKNLRQELLANTQNVLEDQGSSSEQKESSQKVADLQSQIREIRARLNVESAQRLSEQMPLESELLIKVADKLREIDDEMLGQVLKDVGLAETAENKEVLEQVTQTAKLVEAFKPQTAVLNLQTEAEVPLSEVHQSLVAYEASETVKENRFGETLKKVESQIENLLRANDIPVNAKTIEAAKALIQGEMPVDAEHIEKMLPTLETIDVFTETFTPHRAAQFIKEGLNPYKASIQQVVDWLISEQYPEMKESVASAIVGLEEKGQTTEAQKKGLIGIYRVLDGLERNKEGVMGYLYKNQLPLTLEHIDEAIKYTDRESVIAAQVDDAFGELESVTYKEQTAKQLIEASQREMHEVREVLEKITHKTMDSLDRTTYNQLREEIRQALKPFEGKDLMPESLKQKLESAKTATPELIQLLQDNDVPVTLNTIHQATKLKEHMEDYKKYLEEEGTVQTDFEDSAKERETQIKEIQEDLTQVKKEAMFEGDLMGYKTYQQLEETLDFQKQLEEKQNIYTVPFLIEGDLKVVNFYVNQNKAKATSEQKESIIVISYHTQTMGQVKARIELSGERISYDITTEKQTDLGKLEKEKAFLKDKLEQIGLNIHKMNYETKAAQEVHEVAKAEPKNKEERLFEMLI